MSFFALMRVSVPQPVTGGETVFKEQQQQCSSDFELLLLYDRVKCGK